MSFNTQPYRVFTTFEVYDDGQDPAYKWACESCGAHSEFTFEPDTPIVDVHSSFVMHVEKSHKIKREEASNWSLGV